MTEEEQLKLQKTIHEIVDAAFKDRFRVILDKLDNVAKTADLAYSQLDEDRKDFAEIKTGNATIERLLKELVDMYSSQTKRLSDTIKDGTEMAINGAAQAVADNVEPAIAASIKKIKNGQPLNTKKWYHKFRIRR